MFFYVILYFLITYVGYLNVGFTFA